MKTGSVSNGWTVQHFYRTSALLQVGCAFIKIITIISTVDEWQNGSICVITNKLQTRDCASIFHWSKQQLPLAADVVFDNYIINNFINFNWT